MCQQRDVHECGRELKEEVKKERLDWCIYPESLSGGRALGWELGESSGRWATCVSLPGRSFTGPVRG